MNSGSSPVLVVVPSGQGLKQIGELALAFGLSSLIGPSRASSHGCRDRAT
jgi:hypothetical protein